MMELLSTEELLARTGVKRTTYNWIRERYKDILIPRKRVGYALMWAPEAAETLMNLAVSLRGRRRRA